MWGVMQRPCKLQRKETHVSHLDLDQATHNQCGNCLPWEIYLLEVCLHDPLHVRRCAMLAQRARDISIIAWIIADNKFGHRPKVGGGEALADASFGILWCEAIVNLAKRRHVSFHKVHVFLHPATGASLVLHLGKLCQSARRLSDGSSSVQ